MTPRARPLAAVAAVLGLAGLAAVACSPSTADWPAWTPAGGPPAPGTVEIGDLVPSPGGWVAVGAVTRGEARSPTAWRAATVPSSSTTWTPVPLAPVSYYGERSLLHIAALGPAGSLVAVGWAAGGAHGNPRTATWSLAAGTLREQPAEFELFGGPRAIDVIGVASIGDTWVILGNRGQPSGGGGGALWRSSDGVTFALVDEPALAGGPGEAIRVNGLTTLAGGGVVAVGERQVAGSAAKPAAWSSSDGVHWQRDDVVDIVPEDRGVARSLSRVTATSGGAVAVGIDDTGPSQTYRGVTRDPSGRWHLGQPFAPTTNAELPRVGALAAAGDRAAALVRASGALELWWSQEGSRWSRGRLPARLPAGNNTSVVLAGMPGRLVLVANRPGGAQWWAASR